jgi:aspartyl-tRNA(Asn)/glutamyl-tRNA(Gln) amidotransferase subunit A
MRPTEYTLKGALEALAAGETTSVALTEAFLDAIGRLNPRLNAFITVTGEGQRRTPRGRPGRAARGRADRHQGPVLHGGGADHRGQPHPRRLRTTL